MASATTARTTRTPRTNQNIQLQANGARRKPGPVFYFRQLSLYRAVLSFFPYFLTSLLHYFFLKKILTNPSAARSSRKNFVGAPVSFITASAAKYPLRTGPSIVAGQPVAVQSPATKNPGILVRCCGRQRSTPGSGENVAAASLITVAFSNCASRAAGRAWRTSPRHKSIMSWRDFCSKSYDALITSCRYCPAGVVFAVS